ncbi:MAG TPA: D-glycero-beta-D-manno-heptose-7-phosphate kinase [Bacteroidetes bacterium]|nr:D-glycero-beta-D-manno-heptose-7-phosphate kinase [Bacteroidota bacterium]
MVKLQKSRVQSLLNSFRGKKILVLGDLMLDRYLMGQVHRLSPEAPVPIVEIDAEYSRLGGAANVGNNVMALGGIPVPVGIVGNDNSGQELMDLMAKENFLKDGIVVAENRPTTVKTRVIANNQHVVRTDREIKKDLEPELSEQVLSLLAKLIPAMDAVIIEDYNKGLVTKEIIEFTVTSARDQGKIVTVDPKFDHFFDYRNVTVFKPNRREAAEALGMKIENKEQVVRAAHTLFDRLGCQCLMMTLGEDGMAIFNREREVKFIPTRARKVHDVSGAGDTVISTITLSLVAGMELEEAATLANFAAGVVCGEVGIVHITPEALVEGMFNQ